MTQKTSGPLVSVVIPAYNCENYILDCVHSILQQTYSLLEVIIIDDASTDRTFEVLRQLDDHRLHIYRNSVNQGYLKTANRALQLASGELICFQDADDWSMPDRFEQQLGAFREDTELMICGTSCVKYYKESMQFTLNYPASSEKIRKALSGGRTPLFCGNSIMFRREILDKVGLYNTAFNRIGSEDTDWYIRSVEKYKAINLSAPLYYWRQHSDSFIHSTSDNPLKKHSLQIALAFHRLRTKYKKDPSQLSQEDLLPLLSANEMNKKSTTPLIQRNVTALATATKNELMARAILVLIWSKPFRYLLGLHRLLRAERLTNLMLDRLALPDRPC